MAERTPLMSAIVPGRNEEWFGRTVEDLLTNLSKDSEVIAVCDASWPDPPLKDDPRLTVLHFNTPAGQRKAVNLGYRVSRAKYICKLDAHSAIDKDFDVKMAAPYENGTLGVDVTSIPRMYNLYVYDWECQTCHRFKTYQGGKPTECPKCKGTEFDKSVVWSPRKSRRTDFARFDSELHFQYWPRYEKRPETQTDIADVMSSVGACFFMRRDRFRKLGCLDEGHGSWGQFGTEVSCKSWLSGGRQVVNKTTWFSHYFRVNKAGFPYPISGNDQERARIYSRKFWRNGEWKLQARPLSWLVQKFWPVDGWTDADLDALPKG